MRIASWIGRLGLLWGLLEGPLLTCVADAQQNILSEVETVMVCLDVVMFGMSIGGAYIVGDQVGCFLAIIPRGFVFMITVQKLVVGSFQII